MTANHQPVATREPSTPAGGGTIRLGIALALGGALWLGPFMAANAVLLPARIEQIDPASKVGVVALLAIVGSVVAMIANILFGAFSDLTRSRFGRRTPWMLVGSVGASASLFALSTAESVAALVAYWCVFQLFLNAIAAPLLAIIVDRTAPARRGTISAAYGVGVLFGITVGQIVAAAFVLDPQQGIAVFAVVVLLAGPVVALLAPEKSNKNVPRARFSGRAVLQNFAFPTTDSRDFYLALVGKLLFMLGTYAISGYQLYILTDYLGATTAEAGQTIAGMASISLVTSLVFSAISGPISDRLRRRKVFVIGSALIVALSVLVPFFIVEPWAMLVYAGIAGVGTGIYNSVDQALNTEVLPATDNSAKDLGILNMANTGGQILGPVVTAGIVGVVGVYGPVFITAAAIIGVGAAVIGPIRKVR